MPDESECYSRTEVFHKIENLSYEEMAALVRCAQINVWKTRGRYTPKELVQEAFVRAMALERKWQRKYSAKVFFAGKNGVIRSIASHETDVEDPTESDKIDVMLVERDKNNIRQESTDATAFKEVIRYLGNDKIAVSVLYLMAKGCERSEIVESTKLDKNMIDAKVKLIQRRLEDWRIAVSVKYARLQKRADSYE